MILALARKAIPQLAALYAAFQGETTELEADYAPAPPPTASNSPSPWPTRHRMSRPAQSRGPASQSSLSPTKIPLLRHEPLASNWIRILVSTSG